MKKNTGGDEPRYIVSICGNVTMKPLAQLRYNNKNIFKRLFSGINILICNMYYFLNLAIP
jgi:hypothetical protein